MDKEQLQELFSRYLSGSVSQDELQQLLRYFHLSEESNYLTELIQKEIAQHPNNHENTASDEALFERVGESINSRIDALEAQPVPIWRQGWLRIAAAACILLAVGVTFILQRNTAPETLTVSVPNGQTKKVVLPDGSTVWLNAGTRLEYPAKFAANRRLVMLKEGQVFFDVVHRLHQPFIVKTGSMTVTVLGTSFEVRNFKNETAAKVTVVSGKVSVMQKGSDRVVTLLPQQQAVLAHSNNQLRQAGTNANVTGWINRQIVFDNDSLMDVFASLERRYNVHFKISNDGLRHETASMTLHNQPLSDVLTVLSFSQHFSYQYANDSTIVIR